MTSGVIFWNMLLTHLMIVSCNSSGALYLFGISDGLKPRCFNKITSIVRTEITVFNLECEIKLLAASMRCRTISFLFLHIKKNIDSVP